MQIIASSNGEARRFGLDVLRAFAVMCVVLGHALGCPPVVPSEFYKVSRSAIFGVEIFFVLSGFLIGGLLIDQIRAGRFRTAGDLFHFWARRWLRTLPLYYLFLVLYQFHDYRNFNLFPLRTKFFFFLQNFASPSPEFYRLAWSVSVEEYFYLFFPFFCLLLLRTSVKPLSALVGSAAVFLIVPLVLRCLAPVQVTWNPFDWGIRQVVVYRLDSLMYGVGAAVIFKFFPAVWERARRLAWVGFVLAAALCLYLYFDMAGLMGSRVVQVLCFPLMSFTFALLLPHFHAMKRPGVVLTSAVTYLSTISYSLYLSHILVIFTARTVFLETAFIRMPYLFVPFLILVSIPFGAFTYHVWEYPFLWFRARFVSAERHGRVASSIFREVAV